VKDLIAESFPGGSRDGRLVAVWLAGVHDIGKATPAFACQVEDLGQVMRDQGLEMPTLRQFGDDRRIAPHGLAGQKLLQDWLIEEQGWSGRAAGAFAVVVGGHHGVPPSFAQLHDLETHAWLLRTADESEALWKRVQWELLAACAEMAGVVERLAVWRTVRLSQQAQALLTGLVIAADWIASSPDLFPYQGGEGDEALAALDEGRRVEAAWLGLKLPDPWTASLPQEPVEELFSKRFGLPAGARVRAVQREAVRLARESSAPGLLVIEAPMGEGKTEAALAVAEVFAARSGAGGLFLALPTRATSNAMFARTLEWLRRLPSDGDMSVHLAHAKASLDPKFAELLRGARAVAAVDLDGADSAFDVRRDVRCGAAELVAHQWLRGRKKGMLASFTVGTIDQLLFAGLKSRHLALRHLAVAGKVIVIDEVHAYDAYMNVYLERVLAWLSAYRVPVVVLSATLPIDRRRALVEAYGGEGSAAGLDRVRDAYPVLTSAAPGSDAVASRTQPADDRRVDVALEALDDDFGALADRLAAELSGGGCALVVRNTVSRVLQTAERLRERFGPDQVTVAHSRFVDLDRARKDTELLERFGPAGDRPARHIVVASQVAEQSLDIDFDLLVTDLAPVDLLLQRMGRLHRHLRGGRRQSRRPERLRTARCLLTGVDWKTIPPTPAAGSVAVYGTHPLLCALAVLEPHLAGRAVVLPDDINPLVQCAYAQELESPQGWEDAMAEARGEHAAILSRQRQRASVFCLGEVRTPGKPLIGWIDGGVGDADDTRAGRAQVRDTPETIEVLVVQRCADGGLRTLPWLEHGLGGLELPTDTVPSSRAGRAAAGSALRLPLLFAKPWMFDRVVGELEREYVQAWQSKQSPWLQGELLLVLDEDCRARLVDFELRYDKDYGLEVGVVGARDAKVVENAASFDLTSSPWLPVLRPDGTASEMSLREVFTQAHAIRRLVGDLPTQEFALLRLLLAIAHDALDGPKDTYEWEELWTAPEPFAGVPAYLDRHRDCFDLLHPLKPFYQVASLRTEKGEVSPLNKIVADVPNGEPFFTMRLPGVEQLSFAEAARWLVHAQAFDTSGIKSGVVGDPKAVNGKRYPQGVAWLGNLGGVFAEGDTLRETLLLNLIAADTANLRVTSKTDAPAWRRGDLPDADGPADTTRSPAGLRDLYTWQSRRLRLQHEAGAVTGVVLTYGDELTARDHLGTEPMTGWRRSKIQEKKLGIGTVYLPREHDPARAAWRGIDGLIAAYPKDARAQSAEAAPYLRPKIVDWLAQLGSEGLLPSHRLLRVRIVGARYGTQQSVIDEVVDDGVTMSVVLLHQKDHRFGHAAVDAVNDANTAVAALGDLASDLANAAGTAPDPQRTTARDLAFGALDGPYRGWLRDLGTAPDPQSARAAWQGQVYEIISRVARVLLDSAGPAAAQGRLVRTTAGERWVDDALAELYFRGRLNKALSLRPGADVAKPSKSDDVGEE
jgi:CRISPR system Cascade subunit CasA